MLSSVALAALTEIEPFLQTQLPSIAAGALGAAAGGVLGVALGSAQAVLRPLPPLHRTLAWCVAGFGSGVFLARDLGAFAKLGGPHGRLAAATIVGAATSLTLLGLAVALVQPGPREALPLLRSRGARLGLAAVACLVALVTELADTTLLVLRSYPSARFALILAAFTLVAAGAIGALAPLLEPPRRRRATNALSCFWGVGVALGLVHAARLSDDALGTLSARPYSARLLELARAVTDFDRDGASGWFGGGDCAPTNPAVHPRATEIPGNGVDDNCRWGDAPVRPPLPAATPMPASAPPVNVLLVTVDTLRADHVGAYGYPRPTTPNLDAFAGSALRFERAYTSGGWTCLALHSMMAGLYARRLSWEPVVLTTSGRFLSFPWEGKLEPDDRYSNTLSALLQSPLPPLPRWLKARGVRTAAVIAGPGGPLLRHRRWLDDSFDRAVVPVEPGDGILTDRALEVLQELGDGPFFLWVHYYEPHDPYDHHPGLPEFGDGSMDRYDHDVAFSDQQIGRLLRASEARGGRPTAVIVTADHGESFSGGFSTHGEDLHEEVIHVPLLVRGPRVPSGVTRAPASLVDVFPTVLDWTETPAPPGLDGVSLVDPPRRRVLITDLWHRARNGRIDIDFVGVTGEARRLVHDRVLQSFALTDVGDGSRPERRLSEPVPPELAERLGSYLEEAQGLEETMPGGR